MAGLNKRKVDLVTILASILLLLNSLSFTPQAPDVAFSHFDTRNDERTGSTSSNSTTTIAYTITWQRDESMLSRNMSKDVTHGATEGPTTKLLDTTCAIMLYGLPRKFRDMTLPSLKKNVMPYNPRCDYFVHYYDLVGFEGGDRNESTRGFVNATEILDVEQVAHDMAPSTTDKAMVKFKKTTIDEFHTLYDAFLNKVQTKRFNDTNKLMYWPNRPDYTNTTVTNIVKMWHSLQEAWNLMKKESMSSGKTYETVAMLRSDVLYVTKLNFRSVPVDVNPQQPFIVIPDFANYPVNDRMVYGDAKGVEIWANQRFQRLDKYCYDIRNKRPEHCLHDEQFLDEALFPAIRSEQNISIVALKDICFLRVRPDSSVRFDDCGGKRMRRGPLGEHNQLVVEEIVERKCRKSKYRWFANRLTRLECGTANSSQNNGDGRY